MTATANAIPEIMVAGQATVDRVRRSLGVEDASPMRLGGKAFNQAVAIARLGGQVGIATAVGNDGFGGNIKDALRAEGVDDSCVVTAGRGRGPEISSVRVDLTEGRRSRRRVQVSEDERLEPYYRSAILHLSQRPSKVISFTFELPDATLDYLIKSVVRAKRDNGSTVVVNPAPAREVSQRISGALHVADFLIPNREEAEMLLDLDSRASFDPRRAASELRDVYGCEHVCVTLGAAGIAAAGPKGTFQQAAFPAVLKDKIGASDAFIGALIAGYSATEDFGSSVEFGAVCAGIAVSRPGGENSFPTAIDVLTKTQAKSKEWARARAVATELSRM